MKQNREIVAVVVDDEPHVRMLTAEFMREEGLVVYETPSASGALDLLAGGMHVDLLVTDVRMPGMTGFELSRVVRSRYPTVRILYMSGHPVAESPPENVKLPDAELVQKPFTYAGFVSILHSVLQTQRH